MSRSRWLSQFESPAEMYEMIAFEEQLIAEHDSQTEDEMIGNLHRTLMHGNYPEP